METSQPTFKCDETPTPTRFIRDCEKLGLFQDLQNNPFEVTFRNAVQTSSHTTPPSLPEPLSKAVDADTLDTPQVVPNSKRIEDYQHSYPIIEDEEDEIKLSNNYLIEYIFQEENNGSNAAEKQIEEAQLIQVIEQSGHQTDERLDESVQVNGNSIFSDPEKQNIEPEKNVIDLTLSPVDKQIFSLTSHTLQSRAVKEVVFDNEQSSMNKSITDEFLILHNDERKMVTSELIPVRTLKPAQIITSPSVIANKNVLFIPSSHNLEKVGVIKISPKPEKPTEPTVKDRLKTMLKPNQEYEELKINVDIPNVLSPSGAPTNDVKVYTRERNRIAQKRCRLKKKKWITQLKRDTESVFDENKHLRAEIVSLRAEIANLKTLLLAHKNCPVTRSMYQADVSAVVPSSCKPSSQNISFPTTVPCELSNGNVTGQQVRVIGSNICQNKKLVMDSKRVHISQLNSSLNGSVKDLLRYKTQTTSINKPPLKIFIGSNAKNSRTTPVNSPNAVKVIHFNQNVTEITDLTYDSS